MRAERMKYSLSKLKAIDFKPAGLVEKTIRGHDRGHSGRHFKEGDQLTELDLQRQFNVSRTPIRESFRVLEKKGLVEVIPRKGTFVKRISPRTSRNIFRSGRCWRG